MTAVYAFAWSFMVATRGGSSSWLHSFQFLPCFPPSFHAVVVSISAFCHASSLSWKQQRLVPLVDDQR